MEIDDRLAAQIHGILSSDSDSDFDGKIDFDEEYNLLKPPPFNYDSIKDNIFLIPAKKVVNVWEERLKVMQNQKNEKNEISSDVMTKQKKEDSYGLVGRGEFDEEHPLMNPPSFADNSNISNKIINVWDDRLNNLQIDTDTKKQIETTKKQKKSEDKAKENNIDLPINAEIEEKLLNIKNNEQEKKKYLTDFDDQVYLNEESTLLKSDSIKDKKVDIEGVERFKYLQIEGDVDKNYEIVSDATVTTNKKKKKSQKKKADGKIVDIQLLKEVQNKNEDYAGPSKEPNLLKSSYNSVLLKNIETVNHETKIVTVQKESSYSNEDEDKKNKTVSDILPTQKNKRKSKKIEEKENLNLPVINKQNTNKSENEDAHDVIVSNEKAKRELRGLIAVSIKNDKEIISESKLVNVWEKRQKNLQNNKDEDNKKKCAEAPHLLERGFWDVQEVCQNNLLQVCKENMNSTKEIMQEKSKVGDNYQIIDGKEIVSDVVKTIEKKKEQKKSKKTSQDDEVDLSLNAASTKVQATELLERGIWNVDKVCQNNFSQVCKEKENNAKEKMQKKAKDGDDYEMDDEEEIINDVAATIENKKKSKKTKQDSNVKLSPVRGSNFVDISELILKKILDIGIYEENGETCVAGTDLLETVFWDVDEGCHKNFSQICKELVNNAIETMQKKYKVGANYEIDDEDLVSDLEATIEIKLDNNVNLSLVEENGKTYVAETDLLKRGYRDVDEDCQKKNSQACKESANNATEQMQKKFKVTDNYEIADEKIVSDVVATIKRKKRRRRSKKTKGDSNVELSLDEKIGEQFVKATEFLERGHREVDDEVCQDNISETCKENVNSTKDIMQEKSKVTNEYEIAGEEKIVGDVVATIKRKKRRRRFKKTKGDGNVELSLDEEIVEKCVEAAHLLERGIWNVDKVCQNNFSQVCKESVNNAKEKMQKKAKDGDDYEMDDQEEIVSDVVATIENKKESKETEQDSNVELSRVWGSNFVDIPKLIHEKIVDIHIDEENREKCVEATELLERRFREVEVCQDNFSKACNENVNSTSDIMKEKSKVTNKYEIDNPEKIDGDVVATIKRKKRRRKSKKTKGDSSVELSLDEEIEEKCVEASELLERVFDEVDEVCQDNFSQACNENVNSTKDIMQEKSKVGDNYENNGKDVVATITRKKNKRKSKKTKQDSNIELPLANGSNFVNIPKLIQTKLDEICKSEEFNAKFLEATNMLEKAFCSNEKEWQHNFSQIYSETEMKSIFNIDNLTDIIQNKFNDCEVNKVDEQKTIYDTTAINVRKKRWQRNKKTKHAETVELNEQAQTRMLEKSNFDKKIEEKDILNAAIDSNIDETFSTNASRAITEPENKSSKLMFGVQISLYKRHVTDDDLSIRFSRKCEVIPMEVGKQQQQNQMEDKVQVDGIETQMESESNKKKKENLKNQKKFTEENLPINTVIKVQPEKANDNEGTGMSVYFQEKSINNYYSQFIDLFNTHQNFPVDPVISVPNEYFKNSCRLFKDCKKVISSDFWYGMSYQNFKHMNISQHLNQIFIDHYYLAMSYYQFEVHKKILTDYFHGVTKGANTKLQGTVIRSITNSKIEPLMHYFYENIPHQICTYLDKNEPKVSNKGYILTNSNALEFVFNSMLNSTQDGFVNCWKFYRNLPQYSSKSLKYPQITIYKNNVTAEIENIDSKINSRGTNQAVLLPHQLSNDSIFSSKTFNKEFPSIDEVYTKKCANKCHLEITNQPTLNTISKKKKKRYLPFLQNSEENSNLTNSKRKTDSGQVFPKTAYKIDKVEETSKEDNAKLDFGNENINGLDSGTNKKTKTRKKVRLKQPNTDCDHKYQSITVQEKGKILKSRDVNKKYIEGLVKNLENEISKKNFNNIQVHTKLCNSKNRKNGLNVEDSNTSFDDFMKFFSDSSEILRKCEEISSFICEQIQNCNYDNTLVFIENKEENFKELVSSFLKVNKFVTNVTTNCKQMCKLIDQDIKTKNVCNDKNGSVDQSSTKELLSENKKLLYCSQHANENVKLTTNNSGHTNGYLNSAAVVEKPTKVLYRNKNDTSFRKIKDKLTVKKFASKDATAPRLAVSKAGNIKNVACERNKVNLNSINEHINLTNKNISMKFKNSCFDNPVLRVASKKKRNSNNKKKVVADTTILFYSLCLIGLFLTFEMCLLSEARKIHFFDNILIILLLSLFFICQKYFNFFYIR